MLDRKIIEALLREKGETIKDMGDNLGLTNIYANIKSKNLNLKTIKRIADYLDVNFKNIIKD